MPYIKQELKDEVEDSLRELIDDIVSCADIDDRDTLKGVLNYVITSLLINVLTEHGLSYSRFSDIVGTLECAKKEIYRRAIASYEDYCVQKNGDVDEFLRMGL